MPVTVLLCYFIEICGNKITAYMDLKTTDIIGKYEGVAGNPVDITVKYQKFLRDGRDNGMDVSDILYF